MPDRHGQANKCVKDFWIKLRGYRFDTHNTPLRTIDPIHHSLDLPKAGDLVNTQISSPMAIENMKDVTDVIAFLTDDYIFTEPHVSELSDLSQFVSRKRDEQTARGKDAPESDEQRELAMWLIPVHEMSPPSEYALVAETSPEWWHELLDRNAYLLTDDEAGEEFKRLLHKAATRLREHQRLRCVRCCRPSGSGKNEEGFQRKKGWFHRFFRDAA
ncbi:hypothetical protein SB861_49635 [Paraburkholderia sp. SIMBA_049]